MKKILCILFALCLVLTLSACKKQPPVTENAGGESNSAESGDSLVVGGNAEDDNVDSTPFDEPASGTTTPNGSGSGSSGNGGSGNTGSGNSGSGSSENTGSGNTGSGSSGNSGSSNQNTPPSTGNGGDSGNQESGGNTGGSQGGQEDGGNSGNQGSDTNTNDDKLEIQDKDTSGGGWGSMQK